MKKIILITGILLSTSLWADMDNTCLVLTDLKNSYFSIDKHIASNCERNNIVVFRGRTTRDFNISYEGDSPVYTRTPFENLIANFCRYDRNVIDNFTKEDYRVVSCVLYASEPRSFKD